MKKMYFLLLLAGIFSLKTYAQDEEINNNEPITTTSTLPSDNSPLNTGSKLTRCSICHLYHSPLCTPTPTPTPLPLDGGISILLVAGAAYGVKKMRNSINKS